MKILLLGNYNESEILSGPQKFGKRLAFHLALDHQVTFAAYYQDGTRYSFREKLFGKRTIVRQNGLIVYRFGVIPLLLFLLRHSFDIMHLVSFERFSRMIFLPGVKKNATVIYTAHSVLAHEYASFAMTASEQYRAENLKIEQQYYAACDAIVPVSKLIKNIIVGRRFAGDDAFVIYNGADTVFFQSRSQKRVPQQLLSVVFIGNITVEQKGFDILERALQLCTAPVHVYIISASTRMVSVSSHVSVEFVPPCETDRLAEFLSRIDIVVTPSTFDTFSISTLEAMASGCIPVVSNMTGIAELMTHGLKDNIIPAGSGELLNHCLERMNTDRENNEHLRALSLHIAKEQTWEKVTDRYRQLYQANLKSKHFSA